LISQVAQGAKAKANKFIIERIEFAQGRNVSNPTPKETDIAFKGTLGGNHFAEESSFGGVVNFDVL